MVRYRILGPMAVTAADQVVTPSRPKPRRVLALLLLNANHVVRRETLIEELWEHDPPQSAVTTVQTYIYQLRTLLGSDGASGEELRLGTCHGGYVLALDRDQLDRFRFEDLVARGHRARVDGDLQRASAIFAEALALWKGPALSDVEAGPVIARQLTWLQELRMECLQTRIEAELALGRHRTVVGELKALVAAHPLHEWFYGQLMIALHRGSRRAEALGVYQQLRATLRNELALEPSSEMQDLQRLVLTTDPAPLLVAS